MSKKPNLCVVIPVHKPTISTDEIVSLKACKKHLNRFSCFLVHPLGMDVSAYLAVFSGLSIEPVEPSWLSSVECYNKMKLSLKFYQIFEDFEFMLTYELDAYIFNGEIEKTNALLFDFIGAPFFEGYWAATESSGFMSGCNSGFSIRNIQSCMQVLNKMKRYRFHWIVYKIFLSRFSTLRKRLNALTKNKYEVFITGRFAFYFANFYLNEDVVWGEIIPQLFPSFKIADPMSALKFSFEYNLKKSLQLNHGELPLGCHAWYKHNEFWKDYIDTEV